MTDYSSAPAPAQADNALLARALSGAANPAMITTARGEIVWVNAAFCAMYGYTSADLIGQTPSRLQSGQQGADFYARLWDTILCGKPWRGELMNRRRDGSLVAAEQSISPLFDAHDQLSHFVSIQRDVTDSKQELAQTQYLAYHDSLTGLPNRALFVKMLQSAMEHGAATQQQGALLFIDLDKFKPVNDQHGHLIGDALLIAVAQRLRAAVRKTDLVARIGGDEFVILRDGAGAPTGAEAFAQHLIQSLTRPYAIDQRLISIGASVGLARWPQDGAEATALIQAADAAMYQAKRSGGNTWRASSGPSAPSAIQDTNLP